MKQKTEIVLIVVCSLIVAVYPGYVMAQVVEDVILPADVKDTLSATDNRKSFGYCPVDSEKNVLDSLGLTYTIEGCPLSRLYIDNWDKISDENKSAIVDYLALRGYRIEDN